MAAAPNAAKILASSTGNGTIATAVGAIKPFLSVNPAALAGVAGVIIGVLGYRFLHHEKTLKDEDQAAEAEATEAAEAAETPAS